MGTTQQDDAMELLTAVPVSLRRMTELTRQLREQLPPAMERLEDDTLTLNRTTEDLSHATRAISGLADQMRKDWNGLTASAKADLTRLASAQLKPLITYSRGVTVLLVSQAVLMAVTILTLWLKR